MLPNQQPGSIARGRGNSDISSSAGPTLLQLQTEAMHASGLSASDIVKIAEINIDERQRYRQGREHSAASGLSSAAIANLTSGAAAAGVTGTDAGSAGSAGSPRLGATGGGGMNVIDWTTYLSLSHVEVIISCSIRFYSR